MIELLLVALMVALVTRWTRRPYTIALVIAGLVLGMLQLVEPVHLSKELIMMVFLPPLLFEGALHIRAAVLHPRTGLVLSLSVIGTLLTTLIIGGAAHWLLGFDLLSGLLLGAIIAPTDPVSVLATFRAAHVDEELGLDPHQRTSLELKHLACVCAVFLPFETAALFVKRFTGVHISPAAIWGWVQDFGQRAMVRLTEELEQLVHVGINNTQARFSKLCLDKST
jgi:NhaP-type Na+/H+ and K+/H+ antiporter